jgi:Asp-tRNA(Asn)/Glu-tRNA(Gln) amidotransferase A subunit family amidase
LDHVGAFTKTVEDTVIVYNELSGPDEADSSTWTLPKQKLRLQVEKEYKIGIVVDDYFENTSTEISMACEEAVKQLKKIGYSITYVQLPYSLKAANAAQHMVMKAETANYHADQYTVDSSRYGGYLQQFIREGLDIKANDYLKAQKIRSVFRDELSDVFKHVDLLLTPATPTVAPEGILATGSPAYNLPFTNAGVPTLTLPIGMSGELPIGMQLIAAPLQEQKLVDVGYLLQQQTDWHLKTPSMNR